ncbi:MAG: CHAD domain-containing protein, partial [Haliea sp.]|nr:CHAD domain-containing protein [Haliea sp.]
RTTNTARDWDTLLSRARATLSPPDFVRVQPLLEARQLESHLPVLDMLRSERWPQARYALKKIIKAHGAALAGDLRSDAELCWARGRVSRAWRVVQDSGTDRAWHKLRITLKDLRYRLKTLPAHQRTTSIDTALALSKRRSSRWVCGMTQWCMCNACRSCATAPKCSPSRNCRTFCVPGLSRCSARRRMPWTVRPLT